MSKSLHDRMIEYLVQQQREAEEVHKVHMAQWEYFNTPEYDEELRRRLLESTHSDTIPPWLLENTNTEEGE